MFKADFLLKSCKNANKKASHYCYSTLGIHWWAINSHGGENGCVIPVIIDFCSCKWCMWFALQQNSNYTVWSLLCGQSPNHTVPTCLGVFTVQCLLEAYVIQAERTQICVSFLYQWLTLDTKWHKCCHKYPLSIPLSVVLHTGPLQNPEPFRNYDDLSGMPCVRPNA